jgi:hypothetical protein
VTPVNPRVVEAVVGTVRDKLLVANPAYLGRPDAPEEG